MQNILVVSDSNHLEQTFIRQSVFAMRSAGYTIKNIISQEVESDESDDIIYSGFGKTPKTNYWNYFWYFFLKIISIFSRKHKDLIDAYADWSNFGRQMGTARALPWFQICVKLKDWKPDLIHVHFAWNLSHVIPLARFLDIPVVCTVHGSDIYLRDDWHLHLQNPVVKRVVCVSDSMKSFIDAKCPALQTKTLRLFNPVNEIFLQDISHPRDEIRIIMIASFRSLKNHAWLLKSLAVLRNRIVNFECVLIGDAVPWEPDEYEKTRSLAQQLGLAEYIKFVGWQSSHAVRKELDASTVLVLTSESEGLPMVVLESLARQRTPVMTDLPGTRDATDGGQHGVLVPLNDVETLADALLKAHEETVQQTTGLRSGREFVSRNFHPNVHLIQLQRIYDSAMAD